MNRLTHIFVSLSRIHHSLGFGIQSPTDYMFSRVVINQHLPYYAYEWLGKNDCWLKRKLGLLYFRLANWRQPSEVIDRVGASDYLIAGCRKARIVADGQKVELALVDIGDDVTSLLERCDDRSLVCVENIWKKKKVWQQLCEDLRVSLSYDLYYCGILLFDSKRIKQHYKINF